MKLKINSQERLILNSIVEIINNLTDEGKKSYNNLIEFAIFGLAQNEIDKIAQEAEYNDEKLILSKAIRRTHKKILDEFEEHKLSFQIDDYLKNVRSRLKSSAKEIAKFVSLSAESKKKNKTRKETKLSSKNQIPFEIIELGLPGSIDGLLSRPLIDQFEITLEKIKDNLEVTDDEWFPFQVNKGEFIFIIDDDGTIFISTENFPKPLLSQAKEQLKQLASQIYN